MIPGSETTARKRPSLTIGIASFTIELDTTFTDLRCWRIACAAPMPSEAEWQALLPHLAGFWRGVLAKVEARHAPGRLKLWLGYLKRTWPQAEVLHAAIRPLRTPAEVTRVLDALVPTPPSSTATLREAA